MKNTIIDAWRGIFSIIVNLVALRFFLIFEASYVNKFLGNLKNLSPIVNHRFENEEILRDTLVES